MEIMNKKRESWGTIRRLPSGRYQARWRNDAGQYQTAPVTFSTITDARIYLARIRTEIEDGTWKKVDEGSQPFAPFAMRYLETHTRNIKATTAIKYETNLRVHVIPEFGDKSLKSIRSIDVSEWVTKMSESGKSVGTIRGAHTMMSQVMIEAVRSGLINSNPCAHTRFQRKTQYEPNIMTPDEVKILMNAMPERYYTFVAVLGYCGLRFGEAAALKRGRVSLDRKEIDIVESVTNAGGQTVWGETKTYERRQVSLPTFLVNALADHMEKHTGESEDSIVFTASGGGWLQNNNFHNRVWRPIVKQLVKDGTLKTHVTPKDLRATCASWVAATDGVLEAAKRLGHSNTATTTKHYARPIAGRDIKVANHLDEQFNATMNENRVAS